MQVYIPTDIDDKKLWQIGPYTAVNLQVRHAV